VPPTAPDRDFSDLDRPGPGRRRPYGSGPPCPYSTHPRRCRGRRRPIDGRRGCTRPNHAQCPDPGPPLQSPHGGLPAANRPRPTTRRPEADLPTGHPSPATPATTTPDNRRRPRTCPPPSSSSASISLVARTAAAAAAVAPCGILINSSLSRLLSFACLRPGFLSFREFRHALGPVIGRTTPLPRRRFVELVGLSTQSVRCQVE
jgi:hypothetical protein